MDPLDPLTEIINSGQAFSSSIALERGLWLMIGFFFIGAISKSITRGMKMKNWVEKKSYFSSVKALKEEDKLDNNLSNEGK